MSDRNLSSYVRLSAVLSVCAMFGACADVGSAEQVADPTLRAEAAPAGEPGAQAFPPAKEGYTRFVAPVVKSLQPGTDVMHCQYIQAPLDRDIDILDVQGYQSEGGHHAVAYASSYAGPLGTSRDCTTEDNTSQGAFLGGVGGEAGGGAKLPPGVAFRLKKGSSIMLNIHFLNVSDRAYDGHSVLDFKFAEVDPNRTVAAMFVSGHFSFQIPPSANGEAVTECKLPRDMKVVMFSNHMHDYGSAVKTEIVRANGTVELLVDDPLWTYEMQFQPNFRSWTAEAPLQLAAGDALRTTCRWKNTTKSPLVFPREMCIGVSFFLSEGQGSPVCMNGRWTEM
jgi:hypothetical protein